MVTIARGRQTVRPQDTAHLGQRAHRVGQVLKDLVCVHDVERSVRKRQRVHVAGMQLDRHTLRAGVSARLREHLGSAVDADHAARRHISLEAARRFLKTWITSALKSRIPSMRKFVGTLKHYQQNILTFIERPLTNAVGEGINRIIKIVKNRASGFRGLDSFADLIFLTVGDLDIPAQIP